MHLTSVVNKPFRSCPSKDGQPGPIDENDQDSHDNLGFSDLPAGKVGARVKCVRDGVIRF